MIIKTRRSKIRLLDLMNALLDEAFAKSKETVLCTNCTTWSTTQRYKGSRSMQWE